MSYNFISLQPIIKYLKYYIYVFYIKLKFIVDFVIKIEYKVLVEFLN